MQVNFEEAVKAMREVTTEPLDREGRDDHAVRALTLLHLPWETLTAQQVRQVMHSSVAAAHAFHTTEAFIVGAVQFVLGVMSERDTMDRPLSEN